MSRLELKVPPPVVGLLIALLMWLVAGALPGGLSPGSVWGVWLAALLALVGLGFDLSGIIAFRSARTTVNPLRPDNSSALVVVGIYRFTRNPMYVGFLFLLLAWAAYLSHLLALLLVPLYVLYITRFQIKPEERILQSKFGPAFDEYKKRVRRWL